MKPCQYVPYPPHHVAGFDRVTLAGYPSRKSANETPVPADVAGCCVMTPVIVEHPVVVLRVGEQDVPVVHPAAELQDVPSLDPRQVVGELVLAAVLPFWTAVARIARKTRVAGET